MRLRLIWSCAIIGHRAPHGDRFAYPLISISMHRKSQLRGARDMRVPPLGQGQKDAQDSPHVFLLRIMPCRNPLLMEILMYHSPVPHPSERECCIAPWADCAVARLAGSTAACQVEGGPDVIRPGRAATRGNGTKTFISREVLLSRNLLQWTSCSFGTQTQ